MQSYVKLIPYALILFLLVTITAYFIQRFNYHYIYFDSVESKVSYSSNYNLIIGDSYLNQQVSSAFDSSNYIGYSFPGANSKKILQHLDNILDSVDKNIDTCIIITGVNDAIGHYGIGFYQNHIEQMMELLKHKHIVTVISNIPQFPIEKATKQLPIIPRFMTYMYAFFDNHGKINNIVLYNLALKETLKNYPEVIYFEYGEEFGNPDYYWDNIHLTPQVNQAFIDRLKASLN